MDADLQRAQSQQRRTGRRESLVRITPRNYVRAIISLSKRYSSTSAFPGNNYVDLREWLLQDRTILDSREPREGSLLFASKSEIPHNLVVVYNGEGKKWDVSAYTQERHQAFSDANVSPGSLGQMVFIRGFISPLWVAALGSKYNIDPEFFRRNMDYLSASIDRHAYSFPSLASSSDNIFRVCVTTLLHRDDFGGQDLRSQRSVQSTELEKYKSQQLRSTKVCCGDSIVREYSTVCSCFSVLEQWISLCTVKTERGWSVLVWMDQGRPLEKSPPGPWTSHIKSKATALPILQHHHKMAFRTTINRLDPEENALAEVQQSAVVLPLQYDSLLALVDLARRSPQDPMSLCIPLFAHSAFSEVQFLNLMESRIQIQMNTIAEEVSHDALGNLQYFSNILNRHGQQLKDSARALHKLSEWSSQGWAGVKRENPDNESIGSFAHSASNGAFTAKGLLEDYKQLHVRCMELSNMCSRGMTLAMNKSTIEESRKAIEQSARVKKLTLLATLFIPVSFTTSLFGMNIDILGQSRVQFWWFFVFCVPVTLCAYVFYLWDFQALKLALVGFCKNYRGANRAMMGKRNEKEAIHIV